MASCRALYIFKILGRCFLDVLFLDIRRPDTDHNYWYEDQLTV